MPHTQISIITPEHGGAVMADAQGGGELEKHI